MHNLYSVPPRLMHNVVRVRLYEDTLEVYYHHTPIQTMPLPGIDTGRTFIPA
jgi:hypothetical protein